MKKFLLCLKERIMFILVITILGGLIGVMSVYLLYNPSHEYYNISFKAEELDKSVFTDKEYVLNVKESIEIERDKTLSLIIDDFKVILNENDSVEAKNGQIIITNNDSETKKYYGTWDNNIVTSLNERYILIDDYWVNCYNATYNTDKVNKTTTITYEDGSVVVVPGVWNGRFAYTCGYSSFSYIKSSKIANSTKIKENNGIYTLSCQKRCFNTWQQARRFMLRMIKDTNSVSVYLLNDGKEVSFSVASKGSDMSISAISESGGVNEFIYLGIGSLGGLLISISLIGILILMKKEIIDKVEYDNQNIFKTPFHKEYWKGVLKPFKDVRSIVTMSILLACMIACKFIKLPSGFGNLGISLGIFFFGVAGLLYGPIAGALIGFLSNTIGYFLVPTGYPFHIGYGFNAALTGFIYGLMFWKTKITYSKCLFARIIINLFINAFLQSIWWGQVTDLTASGTKAYMLTISLPKNLVYLIPQSILFFLVFKSLSRVFKATNLVDEVICDNMTLF